jgi:hypothetical protein
VSNPNPALSAPGGSAAADPLQSLRATLRGVASVVAPTSLLTALLYYFGWARTSYQARALGLDDSLFGFSTKDYLLRSIDAMFWPLFVGTLVTLAALSLHGHVIAWVTGAAGSPPPGVDLRNRVARWATLVLVGVGSGSLLLGIVWARVEEPSRVVSMAQPICITAGISILGYGVHLRRRLLGHGDTAEPTPELRAVRLVSSSVAVSLILLGLFWSVSRYAEIKGIDLAEVVEETLPTLPDVAIYSPTRLQLQAPVEETTLSGDDSAYRFSYTGLKFLFRSEGKLFLRPSHPSDQTLNIIIPDRPELRLELRSAQ